MKTTRKGQEAGAAVREHFKKRCRGHRNSENSPAASLFAADSDSEAPRRRPRLAQSLDVCSGKHEKLCTSLTAANDLSSNSRSRPPPNNCTLNKNGYSKSEAVVSQNGVKCATGDTRPPAHYSGAPARLGGDAEQTNPKLRNPRQDAVTTSDRFCHPLKPLEATISESLPTSLSIAGYRGCRPRVQTSTPDHVETNPQDQPPADSLSVQSAPLTSEEVLNTKKTTLKVGEDDVCHISLIGHSQATSASFDGRQQSPQEVAAPTNVLQLLLGRQLPSCLASAASLLENKLPGKAVSVSNRCGGAQPAMQSDWGGEDEIHLEGEGHKSTNIIADVKPRSTTAESADSDGITCCSSNSSTLHTHAPPPLYYTVLTSNGLHTKQDTDGDRSCLEEEVDSGKYLVVKGVSRDNTKKRWAVYWKGSRRYFYDKCYANCHQAYLSAVEFRRQAKACNAPGPPPKKSPPQNEFYFPTTPSFHFTSYSSRIASFPTAPSTPPAFPACEAPSPCGAPIAKCGSAAMTLSTALSERPVVGSSGHSDRSASFREREAVNSDSESDLCTSSPTTADSCDNLTNTLQVYRCAAIILLQDLLYEVLPPRVVTQGPTQRAVLPPLPLKSRADERFLSASLLLLQRTLHGHIARAERGGEDDLTQLLSILMPSLDRQLLPSELPRELQQTMLLQLTTLRF